MAEMVLSGYLHAVRPAHVHSVHREDDMSETRNESSPPDEHDDDAKRHEMAEVQEKLDAQSDGEGLAAEAGRGEETGLAEG
jgi:hypothetical protein